MSYVNIDEVKACLGITGNEYDEKIQALINSTSGLLDMRIGDLNVGTHIDQKNICDIRNNEVNLEAYNVIKLDKISGTQYTGTLGKDYRILNQNRLRIGDIMDYVETPNGPYFDIEYTAGFSTSDSEYDLLKQLQCNIIELEFNKDGGQQIKSYKLGPRSFTFQDSDKTAKLITSIENTINLFSPLPPL